MRKFCGLYDSTGADVSEIQITDQEECDTFHEAEDG
jgi:hypothetical protein